MSLKCTTSNKTCINPYCRIRAISRKVFSVTGTCDLVKRVEKFYVDAMLEYKYLGGWRHIAHYNDLDACYWISHPMAENYLMIAKKLSQGFAHKCPFVPGEKVGATNVTNTDVIEVFMGSEDRVIVYEGKKITTRVPDGFFKGDMRFTVTLKNKLDNHLGKAVGVFTVADKNLDTF